MTPFKMIADNDCLRTCIASLLDMGPVAVPNFMENPDRETADVWDDVRRWLRSQGKSLWMAAYPGELELEAVLQSVAAMNPDMYYIVGGFAAYHDHVVIALNDKVVHDPSRMSPGLTRAATGSDGSRYWYIATLVSDKMVKHS